MSTPEGMVGCGGQTAHDLLWELIRNGVQHAHVQLANLVKWAFQTVYYRKRSKLARFKWMCRVS